MFAADKRRSSLRRSDANEWGQFGPKSLPEGNKGICKSSLIGSEASCMRFEPDVSMVVALTVDHAGFSSDALVSGTKETSLRVVTSGYCIAMAPAE